MQPIDAAGVCALAAVVAWHPAQVWTEPITAGPGRLHLAGCRPPARSCRAGSEASVAVGRMPPQAPVFGSRHRPAAPGRTVPTGPASWWPGLPLRIRRRRACHSQAFHPCWPAARNTPREPGRSPGQGHTPCGAENFETAASASSFPLFNAKISAEPSANATGTRRHALAAPDSNVGDGSTPPPSIAPVPWNGQSARGRCRSSTPALVELRRPRGHGRTWRAWIPIYRFVSASGGMAVARSMAPKTVEVERSSGSAAPFGCAGP